MSVVAMTSKNTRRAARSTTAIPAEESEFQGFWLNVGVMTDTGSFARLNRGIAVDDLMTRRVYESTDPAYAAEVSLTNQIVTAIKKHATSKKLGEGEHIVLKNLTVVLYRRQEGSELDGDAQQAADVEKMLFGPDEGDDPVPAAKDSDIEAEVERRLAERMAAASSPKGRVTRTTEVEEDDVLGSRQR